MKLIEILKKIKYATSQVNRVIVYVKQAINTIQFQDNVSILAVVMIKTVADYCTCNDNHVCKCKEVSTENQSDPVTKAEIINNINGVYSYHFK